MTAKTVLSRRAAIFLGLSGAAAPGAALAAKPSQIRWPDLIPSGVSPAKIIDQGALDPVEDRWKPVFDANGDLSNTALDGSMVTLGGFIVKYGPPQDELREFILAPQQSICSHVLPPPPNQVILARSEDPIPENLHWAAVRVTGTIVANPIETPIANAAYRLAVQNAEVYF